jgi:Ran GTPase-activating protein (RanGAP) involved in mRNA processing and transport
MEGLGVNPFVQMAVKEMRVGIVYLDLSSCGLSSEDAGTLAEEIRKNDSLKNLILARNPLGPAGVIAIVQACQGNTSLSTLQFSFADAGFHGARALGRTLAMKQTYLQTLSFTDDHFGGLARALRVNTSLSSLALDGNHIGPSGAEAIASALTKNTNLTFLSLARNEIGARTAFAPEIRSGRARWPLQGALVAASPS